MTDEKDTYELATELERELTFFDISDERKALVEAAIARLRELQTECNSLKEGSSQDD